jgi:hypothetical protein
MPPGQSCDIPYPPCLAADQSQNCRNWASLSSEILELPGRPLEGLAPPSSVLPLQPASMTKAQPSVPARNRRTALQRDVSFLTTTKAYARTSGWRKCCAGPALFRAYLNVGSPSAVVSTGYVASMASR